MLADLTNLEPHQFSTNHYSTLWQIWESLTEYDANYEPQGRLAEGFEVNEDFTKITFHLREGVTWHTGREFTSEDVRYNIARVADPDSGLGNLAPMAQWFESVEAPDDRTITLRSSTPRPSSFDFFESLMLGDPEVLEGDEFTTAVGTAEFMFGEWRPGDQFILRKNPNYWDAGKPYLDEQVFSLSLEPNTMIAQFESGALDVVMSPPLRDYVRLTEGSEYQGLTHDTAGGFYVAGWNTTLKPFDDKRVRQALNWAIDRRRFTDTLLLGTAEPFSLPWPTESIAYHEDQSNHYEFDPAQARALLDAAGVDTIDFSILLNPNLPEVIEFAEIYQEDLAQIGLTMAVEVVEVAEWVGAVNADPPRYNGMYMANTSRANLGSPVAMIILGAPVWDPRGDNNTAYSSPEYIETVDALTIETNPERQRELYRQLNSIILEDSWLAIVAPRKPAIAMQNNVSGIFAQVVNDGFELREARLG